MNFLSNIFSKPKDTQEVPQKDNKMSSFNPTIPPSDGVQETVIIIDKELLNTAKSLPTAPIDLNYPLPFKFENILGSSSVEDGFMNKLLLKNQFMGMAHIAFDRHYGFVLNPSQLFLLVLQQIGLHVNQNSKELRSQFVLHEDKKELSMEIPAMPSNEEWKHILGQFQAQIAANTVPDTHSLLTTRDFASATESEKLAGDITLMDICQEFFEYKMYTRCGIPYFILEGTIEDWVLLREKAEQALTRKTLPEFANTWKPILLPLLDKLLSARRGEEAVDHSFWSNFFKIGSVNGSGGYTYVNGWINCFFPMTNEKKRPTNPFCIPYDQMNSAKPSTESHRKGADVQDFVNGISTAPVMWHRLGEKIPMKFCSGFVGGKMVHSSCVRPEVGWWLGKVDEKSIEKDPWA
jgi:hypothetical protein